eukprot:5061844-Pyramimonas_sp.AAC.1
MTQRGWLRRAVTLRRDLLHRHPLNELPDVGPLVPQGLQARHARADVAACVPFCSVRARPCPIALPMLPALIIAL